MASILVIDDDEQVQAVLRRILEAAGYRVVVASNGQQGLQQFRREPADLVLLDIFMPELDGLETLVALLRDYPAAKVIAMSGRGTERDFSYLECARMLGAHSVLPKPLDREQLLLIVGLMLRGVSPDTDSSYEEGAMEPTVEHRKHRRYPVRFKSIYSTDGVHLEDGLVLDLSLGGCRLTSAIHLPSGIPIEIHIRPDQHSPVYIPRAVVCWAGDSVVGLEFKELPELESATLTRLLLLLSS